MKEYIINGSKFDCYSEAYLEIRRVLSDNQEKEYLTIKDIAAKYIDNVNEAKIIWVSSDKSKIDLGYEETTRFLKRKLQSVPIHELVSAIKEIKSVEKSKGDTLFDKIISALKDNNIIIELN